ncbi:MAG: DUF1796 family putative cysteine peptidase [Deltaproteobacteria bacterium]|nr:DUF1796 family putative cysteine peptidase [Deltaproteobacteria bacterium]
MKICHPFINNLNVISLGYGCAVKTELIRKYFPEQPALFFDYLGNFDGLDTCTQIILNDFQDFQEMDDLCLYPHPKWNTNIELKPISLCANPPGTTQNMLVSRHFVNIVFYHYKHTIDTLQSFKRKSERFQKILKDTNRQTVFLYYRQYDEPLNGNYAENNDYSIDEKLSRLESESIRFRDAIEKQYPSLQFKLISLIMEPFTFHEKVTSAIDKFLQQKATATRKIVYDRVLTSVSEDKRKLSSKSWGRIYRRHLITNPLLRMGKACLTIPFKVARNCQQLRKKSMPYCFK